MQKTTVLVAAHGLEAGLDDPARGWVKVPGGERVTCGPHVFDIVALFREPRPVQQAFEMLAARLSGATALAEAMTTVDLLHREGVLIEPADHRPGPRPVSGFSASPVHIAMLDDRSRTRGYIDAIRAMVRPGDVVIDLGTGTGVLAVAAAQAGAARVYAIEAGAIADCAAALFADCGVGERISLVRGWSTTAALDQRADVLITEVLGHHPWNEGIVALVSDARRRLLTPTARIIPSRVRWLALPVAVPAADRERLQFSSAAAERWREWYGIDFRALVAAGPHHAGAPLLSQTAVAAWPRLSAPIAIADVDLTRGDSVPGTCQGDTIATADGVVDGVVLCWEAMLSEGTWLSTVPGTSSPTAHWRVQLLFLPEPVRVNEGERMTVAVQRHRPLVVSCVAGSAPGRP